MEKEGTKRDSEGGGLLLTNPMACEEADSPTSPRQTVALLDKPSSSKGLKSRPKSPSFLRLLVGSFRSKQSYGETSEEQREVQTATTVTTIPQPLPAIPAQDSNSLSDTEEVNMRSHAARVCVPKPRL